MKNRFIYVASRQNQCGKDSKEGYALRPASYTGGPRPRAFRQVNVASVTASFLYGQNYVCHLDVLPPFAIAIASPSADPRSWTAALPRASLQCAPLQES